MSCVSHRKDFPRQVENLFVQEDNGIRGLSLSGGGNISLGRQMAQEGFNFLFAHIFGVNFCIKEPDKTHDPLTIGLFGTVRIVVVTENLSDLIHEFQIRVGAEFWLVFHKRFL